MEKTMTSISLLKRDREYIRDLLAKAKKKNILTRRVSFSSLAVDCVVEYLENIVK